MKIILGINEDENGQKTPFFVLPDGVIRTFTEGWALFSYVLNISPSEIETREEISPGDRGTVGHNYYYSINGNEFMLEIPSDVDLQYLEEIIQNIIHDIKRGIDSTNEDAITDIKESLESIENVAIKIVSFLD
jgi:hypothetical protein